MSGDGPVGGTAPDGQAGPAAPPGLDGFPSFARDIDATLSVHTQYVLWGNVRDLWFTPDSAAPRNLTALLREVLARAGYELLVVFDPMDRVQVVGDDPAARQVAADILGGALDPGNRSALAHLEAVLRATVTSPRRVGVLIDYASRLVPNAEELAPEELEFFRVCEKLAHTATVRFGPGPRPQLMNPVLWVLDQERDLPPWFTAGNPSVRLVPVGEPDIADRIVAATALAASLPELAAGTPEDRDGFAQLLAGATDGLSVRALVDIVRLARDRGIDFAEIDDAARAYRVGMIENPWRDPALLERVRQGADELPRRVLGQEPAVQASLDVLKRSVLGLEAAGSAAKPRGVLFFAGPTGVGKTELAKAMAELVFGDSSAYLRFDMSEFSGEGTDARLIGAPPGYVGFDAGGELTNGVRQQPFRLLLFDEVEKANPRILDKFLQILDDGRLTDGRGNTVHFSETLIVFTSNLGIHIPDPATGGRSWTPNPSIRPGMPYPELQDALREAIATYFKETLNRPELLNRIGMENLVVFDYVGTEVAGGIFDLRVREFLARVRDELGVEVDLGAVEAELRRRCTADTSLGGRGVGNQVRAQLVNPLSRALFELDPIPAEVVVTALAPDGAPPEVVLR